jgi:2'-5' RNA ligase
MGAMRLFVALIPSAAAVRELSTATMPLRCPDPSRGAEPPALRWTRPEQWHLTLAFLGEVDDESGAELARRLARAAARANPLALSLGSAGRFGNRVLWTRVRGDTEALRRLAEAVRAAARRARLPVEDRPYRPHLTLARARTEVDLRPIVASLAEFASSTWTAERLHLVRSELGAGPDGTARYVSQASWPLGRTLGGHGDPPHDLD